MPTYEQFLSMELVDQCKPEFVKELCDSCWIHNCRRSFLFRASLNFWSIYHEDQEIAKAKLKIVPHLTNRPKPKPKYIRPSS